VGEPFRYGLDPEEIDGVLAERGFRLVWDQSTAEALQRNPGISGADGAPEFYRVAMAEIQDR